MIKTYLFTVVEDDFYKKLKEGDMIEFEMPPFCSGDYLTLVMKDKHGLYIDKRNSGYFQGCRDYFISKKKL